MVTKVRRQLKLRFEASARLQRLFGRELLPDEFSAVEELVKNSYDSNATQVTLKFSQALDGEIIEVRDNGSGMSLEEFRRVWMWAGYSEKGERPLPRTSRVPVGEKGIGRFAADKLGDRLTVVTKPQDSTHALKVDFDWRQFANQRRKLSDIEIPYEEIEHASLTETKSGTILLIKGLRSRWDSKSIAELRRRLSRLLNPYDQGAEFKIVLDAPRLNLSGPIVPSEIRDADFEWEVRRGVDGKTTVGKRTRVTLDESSKWSAWGTQEILVDEVLSQEAEFGPLSARFFYFINRTTRKTLIGDNVPGVAVYRDGLRVEPAGSISSDWLGLLERRAKRAGHMPLVPSRLFGFVEIRRGQNPRLQDATNRRSFVSGPPFDAFTAFLRSRLRELETQVEKEVAEPRWKRSRQFQNQKLIQARNITLSVLSLGLAHELRQPLQSISTAAENIRDHLRASGTEIPQVSSAIQVIRRSVERIDGHIVFLRDIGVGKEETEPINLDELISATIYFFREQAAARNIRLQQIGATGINAIFNKTVFLNTLTNLVLNSYQAMSVTGELGPHEITIRVEQDSKLIKIFVDDDGPGISESLRARLFKRHTTSKQGGMGVGLFMWREALQMYGGDLSCVNFSAPTSFLMTLPKGAQDGTSPDR